MIVEDRLTGLHRVIPATVLVADSVEISDYLGMAETVRPAAPSRSRHAWWGAAAGLLALAGVLIATDPFVVSDTYCGRVAWDAYRGGVCESAMALRMIATVVLLSSAAAAFGICFIRRWSVVVIGLAVVLAAFGLLRLLEPTHGAWCGSVLNRHRYYETDLEQRCDDLLAPHRSQAAIVFTAAVSCLLVAAVTERRRRDALPED